MKRLNRNDITLSTMIEIDYQQLDNDTLENLLTEIVLRNGTDYGEEEVTTVEKVGQLKTLLKSGKAVIMFDAISTHCDVITKPQNN